MCTCAGSAAGLLEGEAPWVCNKTLRATKPVPRKRKEKTRQLLALTEASNNTYFTIINNFLNVQSRIINYRHILYANLQKVFILLNWNCVC